VTAPTLPPGYEVIRDEIGFSALAGPFFVRKPRDGHSLAWGFRVEERHINRGGVAHGGMLVTFADHALGAIVFFAAGRKPCSTIDLACSFAAPARLGDWVECTGEVTRTARDLVFMRGRLAVADRTLLDVKGIWKVLDRWLGPDQQKRA